MKQNIGKTDRIIRIVLGVILAAWGIYAQNMWGLLAIIPLFTALVRFCPFYPLLGIHTLGKE